MNFSKSCFVRRAVRGVRRTTSSNQPTRCALGFDCLNVRFFVAFVVVSDEREITKADRQSGECQQKEEGLQHRHQQHDADETAPQPPGIPPKTFELFHALKMVFDRGVGGECRKTCVGKIAKPHSPRKPDAGKFVSFDESAVFAIAGRFTGRYATPSQSRW